MQKKKKRGLRPQRKTVHLIGEGHDELAFLRYLKALYARNPSVSVSQSTAGGKGPEHIIQYALKKKAHDGYDTAVVLLDTDIEWPQQLVKQAERDNIVLLGSEPYCLEGMLLRLLDQPVHRTSQRNKKSFKHHLTGKSTDPRSYEKSLPPALIDLLRLKSNTLDCLIRCIQTGSHLE